MPNLIQLPHPDELVASTSDVNDLLKLVYRYPRAALAVPLAELARRHGWGERAIALGTFVDAYEEYPWMEEEDSTNVAVVLPIAGRPARRKAWEVHLHRAAGGGR